MSLGESSMSSDENAEFWQKSDQSGVMPEASNLISGEVQATQQIPLGATHFAMFPQTNAILALVLSIASFACGGLIMSIPGLLLAISAKRVTDNIPTHPDRGIANAAYITAIVNICVSAVVIVGYVVVLMFYLQ